MKHCNTIHAVYNAIMSGKKTYKPELYQTVERSDGYYQYKKDIEMIRDNDLISFLRDVCMVSNCDAMEIIRNDCR